MSQPKDAEVQGRLILIRHGRCEGQGRFIGAGSDPALDAAGRAQREELRRWFDGLPDTGRPSRIFTSPLLRARETAEAFTRPGQAAEVVSSLSEINLGAWEGLTYEEIMAAWPREGRAWFNDPYNNAPPGGEGGREFQVRVGEAFDHVTGFLRGGSTVLVVTHAGVIRVFLTLLLELPFDAQWRFNIQPGHLLHIPLQA